MFQRKRLIVARHRISGGLAIAVAVVVVGVLGPVARLEAAMLTLTDSGEGWINQSGSSNGSIATNNYIVGNCPTSLCSAGGEFRDFFTFAIPTLSGTVTTGMLIIPTDTVSLLQGSPLTVTFTSGSGSFAALGTGTTYATQPYTASDNGNTLSISLDASALAAIQSDQGGFFTVSGRVTSPTTFGPTAPSQFVYGFSSNTTELAINTTPVPLPAAAWLLVSGLGGLGVFARRRKKA